MPKISVIIPVYNTEKYLDKCLKTIINQTFQDIEIIIVNDGSTDGSQKIIDKYKEKDSRIKAYSIKNSGAGGARNYGLDRAKGDYIGFIDSDDWIDLKMYEELYNKAIETNADIVTCYMKYHIGPFHIKYKDYEIKNETDKENVVLLTPSPVNHIGKKKLYKDLRFPVKRVLEDFPVVCYLFAKANKIVQIKKCFYNYRFNIKSNISSNIFKINTRFYDMILSTKDLVNNFSKLKKDNYKEELDRMIIGQIFFRIMFLPLCLNLKRKEKIFIYNILLSYLDIVCPNWENNKYYKAKKGYIFLHKLLLLLSKKLYFKKERKKYKNKEEIENIIYNFLKQKEG